MAHGWRVRAFVGTVAAHSKGRRRLARRHVGCPWIGTVARRNGCRSFVGTSERLPLSVARVRPITSARLARLLSRRNGCRAFEGAATACPCPLSRPITSARSPSRRHGCRCRIEDGDGLAVLTVAAHSSRRRRQRPQERGALRHGKCKGARSEAVKGGFARLSVAGTFAAVTSDNVAAFAVTSERLPRIRRGGDGLPVCVR